MHDANHQVVADRALTEPAVHGIGAAVVAPTAPALLNTAIPTAHPRRRGVVSVG